MLGDRIGPQKFLAIGIGLFALKFAIDRALATLAFGRSWSPLNYLIPHEALAFPSLPPTDRAFYLTMLAVALPFVWIGIVVTSRRLRDAGLSRWLLPLFFVPVVNLLFFTVLGVLPTASASRQREPLPASPALLPSNNAAPLRLDYGTDAPPIPGLAARLPESSLGSAFFAVLLPAPLAVGASMLAALVIRDYGWGLFVGMPFTVGMLAAVLHGARRPRTVGQCVGVGLLACIVAALALILCAIEGAGCLIMLMPIALPLAALGAVLGAAIQARGSSEPGRMRSMSVTTLALFAMITGEPHARTETPTTFAVTTSVDVNAPPQSVWPNVIEFGDITAPPEMIFRAGIAYPLRARIVGRGVGAIRYCEFSTGPFVEPITTWDAPRRLAFDVTSNPPPMQEWSPWKIRPPHLTNFLVSHRGQFDLIPLPDGRTRLVGTTWYEHRMWPQTYWRWWSDFLIHRIHRRVLVHVKSLSENTKMADAVARGDR